MYRLHDIDQEVIIYVCVHACVCACVHACIQCFLWFNSLDVEYFF